LVVTMALFVLMVTFFALGAGNYGARTGLVHLGGYLDLVTAALAGYLTCAEVCEAAHARSILPVWSLAKH
jgi:uncharacterized protein